MTDKALKSLEAAVKDAEALKKKLEAQGAGRPRSVGQVEARLLKNAIEWNTRVIKDLGDSPDVGSDRLVKLLKNSQKNLMTLQDKLGKLFSDLAMRK